MAEHKLWFDRPAEKWVEALPLGNGRLGAMVFGGIQSELFRLNDGTAWSGSPASNERDLITAEQAARVLAASREALAAGDYSAADAELLQLQHRYSQTFLPFADLHLTLGLPADAQGYRRSLDLSRALHTTSYTVDGHPVSVESYASHPDGVLVIEVSTAHPDGLDLGVALTSQLRITASATHDHSAHLELRMPSDIAPSHDVVEPPVSWSDDDALALQGAAAVQWSHDGQVDGDMRARRVRRARIAVTTETTFTVLGSAPTGTAADARVRAVERLSAAMARRPDEQRAAHVADHSALYARAELSTGEPRDLALDARLVEGNAHAAGVLALDPALAGLLYNYGRYLLIASSRPGGVPANLQGIWNAELRPPWSSNYTTNINVQMNYWQAEIAQLAECAEPLYDLIDTLVVSGTATARRLYDAPGWVAHHNTDVWGYSEPVGLGVADPKWAFWPLAGPWLIRELWEHLLFGADDDFARNRAWGPIRSSAEFCLAWLRDQADGSLGTSPSTSPENQFTIDGVVHSVAESSTLDLLLIADLFDMLTALAARLGISGDPVVAAARAARTRIPEPAISAASQIREWAGDFEDADPQHRHLSPLYFLHPSDREVTPELAAAASRMLDTRGDESTGWSLVWKIAMRARLRQPAKVDDLLALVFRDMEVDRGEWVGGLYSNFFAAHPPFQIDGNLGFVAGISEALVQSHRGEIELLPALPAAALPNGALRGLVARPGVEVSLRWRAGVLESVELVALSPRAIGSHVVRYGDTYRTVAVTATAPTVLTARDFD